MWSQSQGAEFKSGKKIKEMRVHQSVVRRKKYTHDYNWINCNLQSAHWQAVDSEESYHRVVVTPIIVLYVLYTYGNYY